MEKINNFLTLLNNSGVCKLIEKEIKQDESKVGRPFSNPYNLFAGILFCFAFGKSSLREIESQFKYDLRVIYIMQNEFPTYKTIGNFINRIIIPNEAEIFKLIVDEIFKECNLEKKNAFVDGSKFEANANKFRFVWKPTTFHLKLSSKIRDLLGEWKIERGVPTEGIINSEIVASKLTELSLLFSSLDLTLKENKKEKNDLELLAKFLSRSLDYEEKERICGPNRNSYYKSDHDATAMCLKEDYYSGLGSNMHAAYNVQICVISGFIACFYVSQSRNDLTDFIPLMDRYKSMYGNLPNSICADSGYGSETNYRFLEKNNIVNYVKYFTWEGNVSGRNPSQYTLNDDETITCLCGKVGYKVDLEYLHHRKKNSLFYKVDGCLSCAYSDYCKRFMKNKDEDYKIFEVSENLQKYIQQAERNLLSIKGIEMRVNRSAQVEGVFGILKQNLMYDRFRRKSLAKVSTEFMLTCLGLNIRKLFSFYDGKANFKYWEVPNNLKPEYFKKPSAKRLSNKVKKRKTKSLNEEVKSKYKYKKSCED